MPLLILSLIQGIISTAPAAIRLWETLRPILEAGREPTAEEWERLNLLANLAHQELQAEARLRLAGAGRLASLP